jgi:hypothetical protein
MSTFTPNLNLEQVTRNADVGTWDTPTNANWTLTDLVVGGIATVSLNNSPVVLNAAQFQARQITFNSTLTGSVVITFPTSFTKAYDIYNACTGSSAFVITLETTASGQVICCPPGEIVEVVNDGVNLNYRNLGRIGSYMDFAGSSVPAWISGCSPVKPYLNGDGTTFSSAVYPVLAGMIGTTLPDSRGRSRFALNQGQSRITSTGSSGAGVDGNTLFASGGDQLAQAHNHAITDPGHTHSFSNNPVITGVHSATPAGGGSEANPAGSQSTTINSAVTNITINSALSGAGQNMPPAYVGGLTLIRAG